MLWSPSSSLEPLPLSVRLRSRLRVSSSVVRSRALALSRSMRSVWLAPTDKAVPPLSSMRSPPATVLRHCAFSRPEVKRLSVSELPWSYSAGSLPTGCASSKRRSVRALVVKSTGISINMSPPSPRHCRRELRFKPTRSSSM